MHTVLFRGRWLIGHFVVLATSVTFVALGIWQYGRNGDKQDAERDARAAYAEPAPDLLELGDDDAASLPRVSVSGTYDAGGEVLLRNRQRDGDLGFDVVTPVRLADGTGVLVDRGWVSQRAVQLGLPDAAPPAGTITVRGTVHASRPLDGGAAINERGGRLTVPRVDIERIAGGLPYELRDVWVTAQWQDPEPAGGDPALPDPPESDDVNHLSYAFQWFSFAAIPLAGWPIVLVRRFRHARDQAPADPT